MTEDLREVYRRAAARLPAGVAVVSLRQSGLDLAMTVSSVVSVSLEPPTVLFCVHSHARFAEALEEVGTWAISVLDADAASVAQRCAEPGRPVAGQLVGIEHRRGEASGAALLTRSQSWLECRTMWIQRAGEHDVVTGEVLAAELGPLGTGGLVHHLGRMRPLDRTRS